MKKNMGIADRMIRILIAAVVVILFLTNIITGTWGYVLIGIAVIFVLTSLVGVCPLYSLLGINTRTIRKA
ncbi:hypothetical protein A3860_30010 [Niastella vici]|uniref:Inner membrane protein YgaP-like transmembrane domain-containing protein n=1 Tax=Niastella vici TaxID=1703345 RepID=A0A1V9FUA7_9BACT|nr:DUF2892 domain-containing protein [Niastella vici]OQP61933.1 hypothetical protein A3860_30010 [Niastella vici]